MKSMLAGLLAALSLAVVACAGDPTGDLSSDKSVQSADLPDDEGAAPSSSVLPSSATSGEATFYSATGAGSCMFDKSPKDLDVVAMAVPEFNGSKSCGACLLVKGPKASITVRVTDRCPGCEAKGVTLDLSAQAFAKIADPIEGRVDITYAQVPCSVSGNLAYHYKDGSSKFWTAIQIRNHKRPVAKLEYDKNGAWVSMERLDYNYFVAKKGVGDQPGGLKLRVTSDDGQVLEDTLPSKVEANKTSTGKAQFR